MSIFPFIGLPFMAVFGHLPSTQILPEAWEKVFDPDLKQGNFLGKIVRDIPKPITKDISQAQGPGL